MDPILSGWEAQPLAISRELLHPVGVSSRYNTASLAEKYRKLRTVEELV